MSSSSSILLRNQQEQQRHLFHHHRHQPSSWCVRSCATEWICELKDVHTLTYPQNEIELQRAYEKRQWTTWAHKVINSHMNVCFLTSYYSYSRPYSTIRMNVFEHNAICVKNYNIFNIFLFHFNVFAFSTQFTTLLCSSSSSIAPCV